MGDICRYLSQYFYFSEELDLTRSWQSQQGAKEGGVPDERFMWNSFLAEALVRAKV